MNYTNNYIFEEPKGKTPIFNAFQFQIDHPIESGTGNCQKIELLLLFSKSGGRTEFGSKLQTTTTF